MCMKRKLYYALAFISGSSFFIIINNIVDLVQNKGEAEAKVASQVFIQKNSVPLIFTGRRELNGFKGYHHYRSGYRKYKDNWWYPEAAFVVFPDINTKLASSKAVLEKKRMLLTPPLEKKEPWMLKKHIESCHERYRSYNKNDNSYQPFHGPRKACFSRFFKG
ncbi:BA14K family protein [Bartonella sp. CB169]|uniref:BA14K family protein n=1 Tax=Bartonella sp. CB169 TaxID=3112257 RepID=UPI00300E2FE6